MRLYELQASKQPEKRRTEQQRQTKWGEGNITKSLVHNAERENLWAGELAGGKAVERLLHD